MFNVLHLFCRPYILYKNVKDDLILEFEYRQLLRDIAKCELEIDKTQKTIFCLELTLRRFKRMIELKSKPVSEEQVYKVLIL